MSDLSEVSDCDGHVKLTSTTKKRKSHGRVRDVMKKLKISTHETGKDCKCKRLKCFEVVSEQDRKNIIYEFNCLQSTNAQSIYLAGPINIYDIKQRRSRKNEEDAQYNEKAYSYRVRVKDGTAFKEVRVCYKAFISIHGITGRRVQSIQKALKYNGKAPIESRGKYDHKHCRTPEEITNGVINHISSFKGRQSHYSLGKTRIKYLPDTLNVKKMYKLYKLQLRPGSKVVSYEFYRQVFVTKFNISFGYPRSDTCSHCDKFNAQLKAWNMELKNCKEENEMQQIERKIKLSKIENEDHLRRANKFYKVKKDVRLKSMKKADTEAITMDFQKNLNLPNLTTNDVYYRRQLSFYSFNCHSLSTGSAMFYCYPQTEGGKGADEVVSMLNHYIFTKLNPDIKHLHIFCDSCSGQNKNYTILRFCHYIVSIMKRLDSITIIFPIRGHSYLECDRDMALINSNFPAEVPGDWVNEIQNCRVKPSPFEVVEADLSLFRGWTKYFRQFYPIKCPLATRPIREIRFLKEHTRLVEHRNAYTGPFTETPLMTRQQIMKISRELVIPDDENTFTLPPRAREGLIPVTSAKYNDLMHLKQFCGPSTQRYFEELPH